MADDGWRLGHRPGLDGLRGLAVLLVMLHHDFVTTAVPGAGLVAVTVFFALSGFLIGALLLEEMHDTGRVSLRKFYARRGLRLLPAVVTFLGVMVAVGAASTFDAAAALAYVSNWRFDETLRVSHLWSLAVEEQFYLAFPLALVALHRRPRWTPAILTAGLVGPALWRFVLEAGGADAPRIYQGTDTRLDGLLAGFALALWLHRHPRGGSLRPPTWVAVAGVALCWWVLVATAGSHGKMAAGITVAALGAVMILAVVGTREMAWLGRPTLAEIGRLSYGLYLWHYPIMYWASRNMPTTVTSSLVGWTLSFAAAWASWHLIERPFLDLKGRFQSCEGAEVRDSELVTGERERPGPSRPDTHPERRRPRTDVAGLERVEE